MAIDETHWILRMRRFQRDRTYFLFNRRIARLTPVGPSPTNRAPTKESPMNPAQQLKVFWQPG
jgi:hypothetical protein